MLRHHQSIYAYLGAGLAIAVVAIVVVAGFAASRENAQSLATQQTIARYETADIYDGVEGKLTQMIYWQDAYDKVARAWDQKWIDYQFGPYLDGTGIHLVAIFGPDNRLRFLHTGDNDTRVTKANLLKADGLQALIAPLRAPTKSQAPTMRDGIVTVAGMPYFAAAAVITPEHAGDFPVAQDRQYKVVFLTPATVAPYHALSQGFGTRNLHIARDGRVASGMTSFALNDAAGRPRAWLQWTPQQPGADFLKTVIPAMIVVFFLLALVQAVIVRRWQTMDRALFTAEAKVAAAEEESRTKSVFLGNISHELRTPLNAIIGFSDVLLHRMFGPLGSPRYEEYAGHIQSAGTSLLKIVNDLIEIARIEARDTAVERTRIDASDSAYLAIEGAREDAAAKNITLLMAGEPDGAWCEGSALSLRQAIGRILDNAIRHSPEGATVTVAATRRDGSVVVDVRDHGDGISAERLEGLGKPFGHTESHLVTGNGGAGLGLSIAKGLMRLMGGSLSIASEVGVGTTVSLRLPQAEAPQIVKKIAA